MVLKSFGCSFIFGSELSDIGLNNNHYANGSQLSWPALMCKQFKCAYDCFARPGSGNLQILEKILNQANFDEPSMFVIGWTWIDRFDHIQQNTEYCLKTSWPGTQWSTIRPTDTTDLAKTYYKDLHTEYSDKLKSLIYIKIAIDTLKQYNIPFIMTYVDELMFDPDWNITPAVVKLQKYIDPYMTKFEGQTFPNWSQKNEYHISDAGHPLEDAHLAASEYMLKVFDKQNIIDR